MIETHASARHRLGMTPANFLRTYWQKRPLLVRGAFPQFADCISADDLAGLACEDTALARIVSHDPRRDRWAVANAPFAAHDFERLPKKNWTLLVQDVDKWDGDVAALLDAFAFLPAWRIDDIMVSYAVDGGGVGAHVDHYDVFLVQGRGTRRWRIDASRAAGARRRSGRDPDRDAFREDSELRLLKRFDPTHEWLLGPGDTLYLPPGIPHEGTAVGECLTYSVGMRAPSVAELMLDFAEALAEPIEETRRYADPDLAPARAAHEIDAASLRRAKTALARLRQFDDDDLRGWFGRFITRYRSAGEPVPRPRPLSPAELAARLRRCDLVRNPWCRIAWSRRGRDALLFVSGETHACPLALARQLGEHRSIDGNALAARAASAQAVVLDLVNAGQFALVPRRRASSPDSDVTMPGADT